MLVLLLLAFAPLRLGAQVIETPISFDSAAKVRTITPSLVERLELKWPAWPVGGRFLEARLYSVSTGGRVLVVERDDGSIARFPLSDEHMTLLRDAVDAAMVRSGRFVTEARSDVISQPARGAFVRNQMVLTLGVYGPLMASLSGDAKTGTALYLLGAGASYFVTTAIGKRTVVSRAQNHLSTDGALRGAGLANGLLFTLAGDRPDSKSHQAASLGGALFGTFSGYRLGTRRTDSEAQSMTTFSTLAGLTAFGIGGALVGLDSAPEERTIVGSVVGAGLLGYALGPVYPRRSSYAVTSGDVQMLTVGAILGAAAAVTPFVGENARDEVVLGSGTMGMLTGAFLADRFMSRPFDYGSSDATQVGLGLAAGALLGGGVVVVTETEDLVPAMAIVTVGAILGTMGGHHLAEPPRARPLRVGARPTDRSTGRQTGLEFDPWGAVLTTSRVPGRHALMTLRF